MTIAAALPNQPISDTMLGHRELDRTFDCYSAYDKYPQLEENLNFIKRSRESMVNSNSRTTVQTIQLNDEQTSVLVHLENQLSGQSTDKLAIVQGSAGTGKSCVIREMVRITEAMHGADSCLLIAPTGVAANNISGKTIHSALHLNLTRNGVVKELTGESERNFQDKMRNVKVIICDEMSMVGLKLLSVIDKRLRQAFPENDEQAFGGVFFYFFGDFYQLPPVGDTPMWGTPRNDSAPALHGKLLFIQFKKVFVLKTIMRQMGDQQINFREVLGRLATGHIIDEDYELLKKRFAPNVQNFNDLFKDDLRLKAKKEEIVSYNEHKLRNLEKPVSLIHAIHNNTTAARSTSDDAQGLEAMLWLAEGCRIMLTQNLWTSQGLCNGTMGTVIDVVYKKCDIENHLYDFPICIMVKFDNYQGPSVYDGMLPIIPQIVSFKKSGVTCTRKQFPLRVAYAITIHKSQGITLDKAVVDIGNSEFGLGLTYVALSRVKTIEGLVIEPSFPSSRLLNLNNHSGWLNKREAMDRLMALAHH